MAAFSGFHAGLPGGALNRASLYAASRSIRHNSRRVAALAVRAAAASAEALLFLWMIFALACLLPVVAAFVKLGATP